MRRSGILCAGLTLFVAALACNVPGASTPEATEPPTAQVIVVTATTIPATSGARAPSPAPPTAAPSLQPTAEPSFSAEIRFSETPDPAEATRTFHEGVTRIYAIWTYSGMRSGLLVKREWLREGAPWIVKEEAWDFQKYGASGKVTDISIYDTQNGLPSGHYVLHLYIEGKPQFTGVDPALISFDIEKAPAPP